MDDPAIPSGEESAAPEPGARVEEIVARLQSERLEVLPFYHDLRNQIVHPLTLHVETRYFFRQWKPRLGPVLTLLIMELRDRCYYNPRTGERRDYCWPSQEELARSIGVSVRTVIRALQSPLAQTFIRVQHRYRYDAAMGKKVRTSSAYVVAMDDPLRPEDEATLTRMAAEQLLAEETAQRNLLQARGPTHLSATLADRSKTTSSPLLPDNLADTTPAALTDKVTPINKTDNLAEEEVPSGRVTYHQKKKEADSSTTLEVHPVSKQTSAGDAVASPAGDKPPRYEKAARDRRAAPHIAGTPPRGRKAAPEPDQRDGGSAAFPGPTETPARELPSLPSAVLRAYAAANDRAPTTLECERLAALAECFEPAARRASPPTTGAAWVAAAIVEAVDSGSAFVAPRRIATICERWQRQLERSDARGSRGGAKHPRGGGAPPRFSRAEPLPAREPDPAPALADEAALAPVDPFDAPLVLAPPAFVVGAPRPIANWQLWRLVTDELSRQPEGPRWRPWLEQAAIVGEEDGALLVGTPSGFARDLFARQLAAPLAEALFTVLGQRYTVRFVVSQTWLAERLDG